jgi:hypothetical protein
VNGVWFRGDSGGPYIISDITVTGGQYNWNGGHGVYNGSYTNTMHVNGATASYNSQDSTQDYTGGIRTVTSGVTLSYGMTIENCLVHHNGRSIADADIAHAKSGVGIWLDTVGDNSGADPSIVRYNKVYMNTGTGLYSENTTNSSWYGNISFLNTHYGLRSDCSIAAAPNQENKFYGNTMYGNDVGILNAGNYQHTDADTSINNIFKNNISSGNTTYQLKVVNGAQNASDANGRGTGNVYTYNAFGDQADDFMEWANGVTPDTYAAWYAFYAAANGNTVVTDPLFINPADNNFNLKAASPAIDAGIAVLNSGLVVGNKPDIGAKEFQQSRHVPLKYRTKFYQVDFCAQTDEDCYVQP